MPGVPDPAKIGRTGPGGLAVVPVPDVVPVLGGSVVGGGTVVVAGVGIPERDSCGMAPAWLRRRHGVQHLFRGD
ncbi:hypothetical protein [Streptomyces sp. NBC_01500]|uniref:hypothetical protein n=1 Tax=Streptomyces sp. NBC_01500 TaxID=2903886 RepID=UPI00225B4F35|nr:hypothetical protein [Streptomyces sp. NBC_01500]MCX4550767.1 hypothetical protein [Streptomyces sp. NBC_01500]